MRGEGRAGVRVGPGGGRRTYQHLPGHHVQHANEARHAHQASEHASYDRRIHTPAAGGGLVRWLAGGSPGFGGGIGTGRADGYRLEVEQSVNEALRQVPYVKYTTCLLCMWFWTLNSSRLAGCSETSAIVRDAALLLPGARAGGCSVGDPHCLQ